MDMDSLLKDEFTNEEEVLLYIKEAEVKLENRDLTAIYELEAASILIKKEEE